MKLYYLFLLVMFFLFNSCVEQTPRTKSVAPISVRDTTKRTSRSHLWNSNTSTYKKTKSSYTPSKKTYKRKSSYKSRSRRHRDLTWGLSDADVEQAIHILNDANTATKAHL